jgi:hypothetical protein
MYTVEFDDDNIEIVIVDDDNNYEDLRVDAFNDVVYLRQWNEDLDAFEVVILSPQMWEELICSMRSPEGAFITRSIK